MRIGYFIRFERCTITIKRNLPKFDNYHIEKEGVAKLTKAAESVAVDNDIWQIGGGKG